MIYFESRESLSSSNSPTYYNGCLAPINSEFIPFIHVLTCYEEQSFITRHQYDLPYCDIAAFV